MIPSMLGDGTSYHFLSGEKIERGLAVFSEQAAMAHSQKAFAEITLTRIRYLSPSTTTPSRTKVN